MAVAWTIKVGGASAVSFASLGLSGITRECRSGMEDSCTFRHDGHAVDAAAIIPWGTDCIIYRDGVKWFQGRCNNTPASGDGSAEGHVYELVGPWWWLEQIVYQHEWKLWDPSAGGGAGALVTKHKSRVILFQNAAGASIDSGAQITAVLNYAIGKGAPITIGTIDPAVDLPYEEVCDISCAEALRRCMRWSPDHVAWFDYSTATPTFHLRAPSALGTLTYNIGTDAARQAIQIRPRYDLQVPGITIHYERTNTVDGVAYETFAEDTAGDTSNIRSVVATIELAGNNQTNIRQRIVTEDWPTDLNDKAWWKAHMPVLKEIADADLTITGAVIKETGGAPDAAYPRILLEGQLQDWMDVVHTQYTITSRIQYDKKNNAGVVIQKGAEEERSITLVATDAHTRTYSGGFDADLAEDNPVGVAAAFYASWNRLHYDGVWSMVSEDVPAGTLMGKVLNLSGGAAAWASMAAIIYGVAQDIDNGVTRLEFGPNKYLGLNDLLALLRTVRRRRVSWRHKARTTGETGGRGASINAAGPTPKNEGGAGHPSYSRQVISASEEVYPGLTVDRFYNLDAESIPSTGDDVELTAREVSVLDADGVTLRKRVVLCSEPYGEALPGLSLATETRWYNVLGGAYVTSEPADDSSFSLMAGRAWMAVASVASGKLIISNYQRCVKLTNTGPWPWSGYISFAASDGSASAVTVEDGVVSPDGTIVGTDPETGAGVELTVTGGVVAAYAGDVRLIDGATGESVTFVVEDGRLMAKP